MLVLAVLMVLILVIAGAVVLYVAFPHRGEAVPGAPWLGEAMKRSIDTVGDLIERPADSTEREHVDR
jgi:hypothetical protein